MDNEQRAALRKLAEEATPGPWYCKHHNEAWSAIVLEAGSYLGFIDAWSSPVVEGVQCSAEQLSNYIAAANPSTILQLLDYIETLEKADIAFLNQQLAEKDAEIERLSRLNSSYSILTEQLAASQAREQQFREMLKQSGMMVDAFFPPGDTTALQSMIAKAGDVALKRAIAAASAINPIYGSGAAIDAISTVRIVTLEDLK